MELHGKATVVLDLQLIKSSFLSWEHPKYTLSIITQEQVAIEISTSQA